MALLGWRRLAQVMKSSVNPRLSRQFLLNWRHHNADESSVTASLANRLRELCDMLA